MTQFYGSILDHLAGLDGEAAQVVLLNDSHTFDPADVYLDEVVVSEIGRQSVTLAVVADATAGTSTLYVVEAVSIDVGGPTVGGWVVALEGVDDESSALVCWQEDLASPADPYTLGAMTGLIQIRVAVSADDIGFQPDNPTHWGSPTPGTVGAALDEIAERLAALEGP